MRKKSTRIIGVAGLLCSFFLLVGCHSSETLSDGTYTMEVASVEGQTITGVLGERSDIGRPDGEMAEPPEGTPPSGDSFPTEDSGMEKPDGNENPPDNQQAPSRDTGFTANSSKKKGSVTINDATAITSSFMQQSQEATVADISEGTVIEVTVTNGVATELTIYNLMDKERTGTVGGEAPARNGTTESTGNSGNIL